jgi:hypothetical protein
LHEAHARTIIDQRKIADSAQIRLQRRLGSF